MFNLTRRAARLLICAVAWILTFNAVAMAADVTPWFGFSALAVLAPITAKVTNPLFIR